MLKIILKRILASAVILFLMISFLFFLLRISPGDPAQKFISPELSPELAAHVRNSFNLDETIFNQYKSFLINAVNGDFGISYNYRIPVSSVIKQFLPFTIIFSLLSFIIQISAGLYLSLMAVKRKGGFLDKSLSHLSLIMFAIPSFVTGVVLIFFFSELLNIFPSSGLHSFDFEKYSFVRKVTDLLSHIILPLITLSLAGIAVFYKYLRDNLENVFGTTNILYLRSHGFDEKTITKKHVIPNALSPLISVAGVELGVLFGGALITEVIFGLPGMGRLTMNSILTRDYPLVIGTTFTAGALIILSNFLADLIKSKIDKRLLKGI